MAAVAAGAVAAIQFLPRDQAVAEAPAHRLDAIAHADALVGLAEVAPHRVGADRKPAGDLNGVMALAELVDSAQRCSPTDFPIACDLFQAAKARQVFYGALEQLLQCQQLDGPIEAEIQTCRTAVNGATALTTGYCRDRRSVLSVADGIGECLALASMPLDQRPKPISTGIPSLDLDMLSSAFRSAFQVPDATPSIAGLISEQRHLAWIQHPRRQTSAAWWPPPP